MQNLIKAGRKFYGICMAALGIQQLFYGSFRTVFIPPWPSSIPILKLWVWLFSAALIGAGIAVIIEKKARVAALILGGILLLLFVFWHLPYMIFVNPYTKHLGVWADATKALALSGGAFTVADSFSRAQANMESKSLFIRILEKFIPSGRVFFSIMMITFGIDHFLYTENIGALVPGWIPGHIFWTYFAGVALIGSGIAIIFKVELKLIGMLTGTMIFLWFVLLHITRAIAYPYAGQGNEITSAFEALGFSGIAIVIACVQHGKVKQETD